MLSYIHRGQHHLVLRSYQDGLVLHSFNLTEGSVTGYYSSGYINETTVELFVRIENFLNPGTTYRCLVNKLIKCEVGLSPLALRKACILTWV